MTAGEIGPNGSTEGIVRSARAVAVIELCLRRNPEGYGRTAISAHDRAQAIDALIRECRAVHVPGTEAIVDKGNDEATAREREAVQEGYERLRRAYREAGSPNGPNDAGMLAWANERIGNVRDKIDARRGDPRVQRGQ